MTISIVQPAPSSRRNVYMNEKKNKFFGSGKGGPLTIEETNRTSHLPLDSYNFCRAFHGGS